MADEEVTYLTKQSDVWVISFAATLVVLFVVFVAVCLCWDRLCAKIAIDALQYGFKQIDTSQVVF